MRGTVASLFLVVIFMLFVGVALIALGTLSGITTDTIAPAFQTSSGQTEAETNYTSVIEGSEKGIDNLSVMFAFGFIIICGVMLWYLNSQIDSSPLLLIVSILLIVLIIYTAAAVANIYQIFAAVPFFAAKASQYSSISFSFQYAAPILAVLGLILAYLFHRRKTSGGL